ncbi:uncharacterized protein F5Z01DRAFT_647838 [Emericellopsis atlantica]|uniref:DUF924-domain-containing protein n=1 Tax=Emericellopsis atlantica TaxID=2614577 RepID=A0A9P7ZST1_9HYPO|nr:uncharacterized protein F5Z01DRAFT_647838 [Emericellopsis atlantica]KAG9257151.1 hypothetical protein F5Z01DRAFT_647838 [Emericellopsis atlantica]
MRCPSIQRVTRPRLVVPKHHRYHSAQVSARLQRVDSAQLTLLTSQLALSRPRLPRFLPTVQQHRASSTTASTMADLKAILTPELLEGIRDFWFSHVGDEDSLICPAQEDIQAWFMGGEDFDNRCIEKFVPVLEAIKAANVSSGKAIVEAGQVKTPLDYLSLLLLLDQLPRNCYRGMSSDIVFRYYDPLARDVAEMALAAGVLEDPSIRWVICRRMWFCLPLVHSEDLPTHSRAMKMCEDLVTDMEALVNPTTTGQQDADADEAKDRAARVVDGKKAVADLAKMQLSIEEKHMDILRDFGRYPHRNAPLGRVSSKEEEAYLANGGESFAPPAKDKQTA